MASPVLTLVDTHYRRRADLAEAHRALWQKFLKGTRLDARRRPLGMIADPGGRTPRVSANPATQGEGAGEDRRRRRGRESSRR